MTFRCPWCDVVGASPVLGHHDDRRDVWLLVGCPNPGCRRGALVRVPAGSPWERLDTGDGGLLLADACVLPRQIG